MPKLQTYSVPEIKEFQTYLRILLRHFQLNGKSTHLLNKAITNLEMKKVHMFSWYLTRMSYLLSACKLTVDKLIALYNVLVSIDIKKEERAYIMGLQSMIIFQIQADIESEFGKFCLRKLDADDTLISKTYYTSIKFADNLKSKFKTTLLNKFLNDLEEDKHGNLICNLKIPSGKQYETKLN